MDGTMGLKFDPVERVASRLGVSIRTADKMRLVRVQDAHRIVMECEASHILILGIDVLRAAGLSFQATDMVADYSTLASQPWPDACAQAAESARAFLARMDPVGDLWLDFTLQERQP